MKNLYFLVAFVFVSFSAFSQEKSSLTGPAYKNYKPWKHKTEAKQVYTSNSKAKLSGPEFKNYKPWKKSEDTEYTEVVADNKKANLTGPEYKNYKPRRQKEETVVASNL